jgi:type 1 glutamine amidotransferase
MFHGVDAVIIFSDGQTEARHPVLEGDNLTALDRVLTRGAGLGLLHYAVEPAVVKGRTEFLRWIGGYYEVHRSVNPHWTATFDSLPRHPITRGVSPFSIRDEWYFYMRFVDDMKGVTPLLVDIPPPETMARPDGPHEGNPEVRAVVARREPQTMAWAYDRADGGRGFGFTGAHYHQNWGNDNFRKLVLNAILWLAKMEVPATGVASVVTHADLQANLDPKPAPKK